ncbi:bifunctional adenosylcobinamide kinase/adenosylcobinamide-phosphate guanylyltransferase [Arsenicicoccus dermatophilus]|uniref:bifunctional adenosylcobinamide kinase/adenosylcobinamide-phosphate guanylyltransferase n=1 Tax=Arsenicicoccus dermatophilus TaxID=1076331 RepID=UPI001F4C6293|nr:bifunctional adenosylcobinamide kinase/adenosylcobinamide-phosphate guanylyltransferase [Arsenicicoccus dermatophilus]MCH8612715.1 bifunctional adenosylcobinamide kinase/adenosylcobinamide-phosphate guanylyltransferase [Arsenicicoccus dermatophilus]
MITLVTGGVRSGKSTHAEGLVPHDAPAGYVAPGLVPLAGDEEWTRRVRAHQARRPRCWTTVESADLAGVVRSATTPLIVDCLGTWVTRLIDDAGAWDAPAEAAAAVMRARTDLVTALRLAPVDVVLVTNEVGWGVVPEHRSGRTFRDELGRVNAAVSAVADRVHLVVCGRVLDLSGAPVVS